MNKREYIKKHGEEGWRKLLERGKEHYKANSKCWDILILFWVVTTMLFIVNIIVLHERIALAFVFSFITTSIIFIALLICFPIYQICKELK